MSEDILRNWVNKTSVIGRVVKSHGLLYITNTFTLLMQRLWLLVDLSAIKA